MTDEAALLAAIHANPDEDTPRLVYADWLDEHGQPERAEFIRVQIELSHLTEDDERERPLRDRRWELWEAHREQWTAEIGIVESDKIKVEFRRGFIDELNIYDDIPAGIALACSVPGVRRLTLGRVALTPETVRALAALDLDSLTISDTPFPREWLELLEPLPCGTVLNISPKDAPFPADVWHEFQSQRIGRLSDLAPAKRHAEARRWQRGHDEHHGYTRGRKTVCIQDIKACDVELRLLAELNEIEEVRIDECDLTAAGIEHIAKLPNLKSLNLFWVPAMSVSPLSRCTTLEKLRAISEYGITIDDAGTEGLEQLANLRELTLRARGAGELTLARLGSLRKLTSLDIELQPIKNAESFAPLSNLTALERLDIGGDVPGDALRFLAPCRGLQTMKLQVPAGVTEDFASLGALTELLVIHLQGEAVTDAAIRHLAPLKKLRTLMVQRTEVTPDGARWLADRLPEATIILDEYVAKSRRAAITFCRRLAERDDGASALLPTHWGYEQGWTTAEPTRALNDDGWENISVADYEVVGPASLRLYARDESNPAAVVSNFLRQHSPSYQPVLEESDIVALGGNSASRVYSAGRDRSLVAIVENNGKCAVLTCDAPATRFEEFRPLFLYIAWSLRVGPAALEGVGEEVTVPVSGL